MNPLRSTPEIDIPGTLGSLVVGVQFNAFLYGLCLLQLVTYFTSGARDRLAIRLMIVWVLFIDTAITAMSLYMLWEYVVANFSNEAYMLTGRHITYPPALTALGACPIQIFLAYRVKRLSGSWVVFTVLVLLTITEGCLGIATTTLFTQAEDSWLAVQKFIPLVDASRMVNVITDIAISGCLIFYLQKSRNGSHQTDYLVKRLIYATIESGSFAGIFAILLIVTVNISAHPIQLIFMAFSIPMGRIYTNTFLAILNSRKSLRRRLHDDSGVDDTTHSEDSGNPRSSDLDHLPSSNNEPSRMSFTSLGSASNDSRRTSFEMADIEERRANTYPGRTPRYILHSWS